MVPDDNDRARGEGVDGGTDGTDGADGVSPSPGPGPEDPRRPGDEMFVLTTSTDGAPAIRPVEGRAPDGRPREEAFDVFASRDTGLEQELAISEADRKRAEADAGQTVEGVVYTPHPDIPRRRLVLTLLVVAVIVAAVWFWGVPLNDAELVVQYNEGVLGGINVDARVENHGTRALDALTITVSVQDSTDTPISDTYTWTGSVAAHSRAGLESVGFKGDQWETYHIFVSWEYDSGGRHYEGSDYLSTEGDAMNVWFSVVMD